MTIGQTMCLVFLVAVIGALIIMCKHKHEDED